MRMMNSQALLPSRPCSRAGHITHKISLAKPRFVIAAAKKGFGNTKQSKQQQDNQQQLQQSDEEASQAAAPSTLAAAPAAVDKEEEIEAMLRRRKNRKVVKPQVKVQSAAVDMATGKAPANPVGVAETRVLQSLGIFFSLLLVEGLLLAASGFLPVEWDPFFRDVLYPSFSPQMLLFLGMSSAYGLWKTGKLPGQQQIK